MANRVGRLASILIVSLGLGFNTYALKSGTHCLIRDEGTTATFACPCTTGVGSFSKSDEKGTIWSNGIVAKDKRDRFSFENDSVTIRDLIPSDQGEFVWVCDETYWETSVCLTVRAGEISIFALPSFDRHSGDNLTITVRSNSSAKASFVSCKFSPNRNCSDQISLQPVYSSNNNDISTFGRHPAPRIVKRSVLDFDIVFDMVSKENDGCYVCQEMVVSHAKPSIWREGKQAVAVISVNTGTWNWQPLAVAIAGAIVLIFAVAIAVCLVLKRDKRGGIHYVSILEQNNFDRFIPASVESKQEPKDGAPPSLNQTKPLYSIDYQTIERQRELEKQLLVSLSSDSSHEFPNVTARHECVVLSLEESNDIR